eukprot:Selendium_serpulae@DN5973_c0_g1_i7.p1
MSRHSKNNTAHSIFTYHERKMMKDVGTLKQRLSGDSLRKFEQCWLCLRTARNPVATPKGYIYCKECIILNFARQKDEATRGLAAWMNSEAEKEKDAREAEVAEQQEKLEKFAQHTNIKNIINSGAKADPKRAAAAAGGANDKKRKFLEMDKEEARSLNFWIPENTPSVEENKHVKRPTTKLVCPMTQSALKVKELVDLKPELLDALPKTNKTDKTREGVDKKAEAAADSAKWVCSLCQKQITHQACVAVKFSGHLFCKTGCFDEQVAGGGGFYGGSRDVGEGDTVALISGGTGFAAHNNVVAEKYRSTMQL